MLYIGIQQFQLGMKSYWINTLSHCFKVPTNITLSLLTNKTYSFNNVQARQLLAQYIHAIIQYGIGCSIVNIANQFFFAY